MDKNQQNKAKKSVMTNCNMHTRCRALSLLQRIMSKWLYIGRVRLEQTTTQVSRRVGELGL